MKKAFRLFSIALALLMILPMLVSLPVKVSATEPAIGYNKTYAAASDGELLYKADFRGTSGVWSPGAAWCGMTATKAADGSNVKLKPQSGGDARGCAWRGELNTTNYTAIGCSYTITFTLDGSNDDQYVGFFPDWKTGFIITPGQKKTSVGQCDGGVNLTAVAGEETYTGGGDGAQSYAVEFSVGSTKNGNYYVVSAYKLYVRDGVEWTLIRELNASQRSQMCWSDGDPEVVLGFFRNPVEGQLNQTVTVSDLKVYRGLCADSLGVTAYEAAQDGDLLYRANFKGTSGVWTPGGAWCGMNASVASDGSNVKLRPQSGADARGCAWRGELNTTDYTAIGCSYTITFTLEGSNADQYVGFFPDWKTGFIFTPGQKKTSAGQCDGGINLTAVAGEETYTGGGDGAQSYAVEFSVANTKTGSYYDVSTYKLYVRDGATWKLIRELNASQRSMMRWSDGDPEVVLGFFRNPVEGQLNQTVTVSNLNVYKSSALSLVSGDAYFLQYRSHADSDEMMTVDFENAAMMTRSPSLINNNDYNDLGVEIDGGTVTLTSLSTDSKRGIWGAPLSGTFFPLSAGAEYTFFYHLALSDNIYTGFYIDGTHGVVVKGDGTATLYRYDSRQTTATVKGWISWADKTDVDGSEQDFAVTFDYDTKTVALYVKVKNGLYAPVLETVLADTTLDGETSLQAYFFAKGSNANETATISDFTICKGDAVDVLDPTAIGLTAYNAAAENALLHTVNFNAGGYHPAFADTSNDDATVNILGNDSVRFTVKNAGNKRAMWGDYTVDALPLYGGVKYSFVFDLTFGCGNVGFGVQLDGNNALVLDGDGNIYWYDWNSRRVGASDKESENWANCTDVDKTATQTFVVTMDYDAQTLGLYVKQSNGSFGFVRSVRYENTTWNGARVRARFYVRAIDANQTPDATYTATVANLKIYKGLTYARRLVLDTVAGAAVRLDVPTGLRFTGVIGKDFLDGLRAEYGNANVKVGMFITPTDYLTANSLDFTKEALDGCGALPEGKKYRKIEAATILETEDGAAYKINCVLSNVLEANYGRAFSAITYIEINGNTYYYSNYFEEDNSRSIFRVADAALLDLSDTEDGEYRYQVAYTSEYSPYTAEQRATLEGFRIPGSFTVMSYNIEVYGHGGPGWNGRDPEMAMQTVRSASPDIVGFQEADDNWNGYFSALTSNGYTRLKGDAATDGSERVEIFYKTDKFTKVSEGTYKYKSVASSLGVPNTESVSQSVDTHGRIFHYAVLREIATGKKILFINTHLHYGGTGEGHEEDDKMRRYEIRTLLAWIEEQNIDCDCTVIVGDMNSAYSGGQGKVNMALFTDAGYEITRDSAKVKGDTGGTLANSRTTRQHYVFDYVMTQGSATAMSYTAIDNRIDNGGTTYPSDHLPVMATILFD
ncbi:MAG: hypothetical protein J6Z13_05570 [Clostridia bacterium]|nr:hypothetical protein [Clostridia bacterium]